MPEQSNSGIQMYLTHHMRLDSFAFPLKGAMRRVTKAVHTAGTISRRFNTGRYPPPPV